MKPCVPHSSYFDSHETPQITPFLLSQKNTLKLMNSTEESQKLSRGEHPDPCFKQKGNGGKKDRTLKRKMRREARREKKEKWKGMRWDGTEGGSEWA
jgi:hypothetical protein